jgi:hypothetical protein
MWWLFSARRVALSPRTASFPDNKWRTPAPWLAVVENGLVKEWRVYADNKPVYDILAKSSSA